MPIWFKIVDIGAFAVNHLAEHALFRHVECRHLEEVVGAVFEHHAVFACLFGYVDKLPAILNGCGCRNLNGYVFSMLHGVHSHRDMCLPVGADVNEVDIVALAKLFVCCLADIFSGAWQSFCFQNLFLYLLHVLRK